MFEEMRSPALNPGPFFSLSEKGRSARGAGREGKPHPPTSSPNRERGRQARRVRERALQT